jgi:hypothetical protein
MSTSSRTASFLLAAAIRTLFSLRCPRQPCHVNAHVIIFIAMPNDVAYRGAYRELNSCVPTAPPICPLLFAKAIAKADPVAPSVV